MAKGAAINISGSMYPRTKGRRTAKAYSRKRKSTGDVITTTGYKKLRGSGDYTIYDGRRKQYTPFADVGQRIGSFFGAPGIGFAGGHLLGRILGSGDYVTGPANVEHNILMNGKELPEFVNTTRMGGSNIVCHREYIADVVTSSTAGAFSLQNYFVNPGLRSTFPWLATVAQNYEQYKLHGIVFEFKTTSSDALNSTNTALGSVILSTDYNPAATNYSNKQSMQNAQFAQSAKPSLSQLHGLECAPSQTPMQTLFVRSGAVPSGQDQRMFDLANFQIATVGFQGTSVTVGELWVTYCVEFLKPQVPITQTGDVPSGHLYRTNASSSSPLGSIGVLNTGSISLSVSSTSLVIPALPIGTNLLILVYWRQTDGSTTTAPTTASYNNLSNVTLWNNNSAQVITSGSGTTTNMMQTYTLQTIASGTSGITWNTGATFGTAATSSVEIFVTVYDESV